MRTPISFRQAHVNAMQAKLYLFDQALKNEIVCASLLSLHHSSAYQES